ncbi:hypothetical protein Dda_1148 [Drechslerella dactyloides]|uniref:GPR1/FUN34/YaaH-class plasma membrane protein n=1 Tax=Drechslerella dactyloides TaxID=74499 RepID=A0AAD6J5N9_DREDA|nr:hypothetical protein Dda_1148 [Drechslerella dactyloides]
MDSEKAAELERPYVTLSEAQAEGTVAQQRSTSNHAASKEHLEQVRTLTMPISPELFEKLYLTPEQRVPGDLRKRFGNPTPIAILGFCVSLTPLSMNLMGWRGAGGAGAAQVASFYFIGGMLSLIGGLFEFILGNTFAFVVFTSFAGFWMTLGGTLTPSFNAMGWYSESGTNILEGDNSAMFNASYGFYVLAWAMLTFIYLICSLRTNVVYVILFATLDAVYGLLVGVYFAIADGEKDFAHTLLVTAGACGLVSALSGWYILFAQLLEALDFPLQLPVGDLSHIIVSASERRSRAAGKKNSASVEEAV